MRAKLIIMTLGIVTMLTMGSTQALAGSKEFNVHNDHGGRAFGKVSWNVADIKVTGTLVQEERGKNSFLYLKWIALGKEYNKEVAGVGGGGKHASDHANFSRHFEFPGGPSEIRVTVCSQVKGKWRCGTPQGPL